MATLTRGRDEEDLGETALSPSALRAGVPTPFPRARTRAARPCDQIAEDLTEFEASVGARGADYHPEERRDAVASDGKENVREVLPSIAYVQRSCVMTLNTLLSKNTDWQDIVPDRRHSLPPSPYASTSTQVESTQSSSALQTLVSNLRNHEGPDTMVQTRDTDDSAELIRELKAHVGRLTPNLDLHDVQLVDALVSLLAHFDRLSAIISSQSPSAGPSSSSSGSALHPPPAFDPFDTLRRQVSDLQVERLYSSDGIESKLPPVLAVETSLLWSRIDQELETVQSLCRRRTELAFQDTMLDSLPPEYDAGEYEYGSEHLPMYDAESSSLAERASLKSDSKTIQEPTSSATNLGSGLSEKMKMDLEAVTMAIDRLYLVAPQLHNQRVELKKSKVEQLERARLAGPPSGKEKERDLQELDGMLELLGKASSRRIADQSVVLEGGMEQKLEKAKRKDKEKREAFVEQLAQHSDAGRLHSQDAVLNPPKERDPETLLSLPEFIREPMPRFPSVPADLNTLGEVSERTTHESGMRPTIARLRSQKSVRSRSLSSPPLSWLLSSSSRASSTAPESKAMKRPKTSGSRSRSGRSSRPGSSSGRSVNTVLAVDYVAEHHENLQHVLVFFTAGDVMPGTPLEAEVLPSASDTDGERLVITGNGGISPPLSLPVRVVSGIREVRSSGSHFEVKLPSYPRSAGPVSELDSEPLMDARQLSAASPSSFACSSCSLPLVQAVGVVSYRDLPSEHWAELVEAWMCHADQKVHDQVAIHTRGIWPKAGQALVGGSYILFDESSVVKGNLVVSETKGNDDWRLVRCLCGAVKGRCQAHCHPNEPPTNSYRFLKYAIRTLSTSKELPPVPLSAFIVEDMMELVQAHATYRFVVLDEESERPRILIWLFKPSIRISYNTPATYLIPQSDSIRAAKVLFKIIGPHVAPEDLRSTLDKFPGFPQAENLSYPLEICRRLAGLLKESNNSYPVDMRTMTGLDVGWLRHA
ncbi:hypothetical protein GLOTRDRAFT_140695 [Gloeophyllum trabeum ATCC 11539]|uniref:HECT domain-containing protein n=1 Tax=Gloeophyllum trabeum (strain ATCC 11539 / FP-39264 / Madison 617) TaxID=670483 RepID=S7RDQ0_GLOTA|nr:uncharacterized protein GLOTRDRAFT_140695 [Gloeophyllum trabeum ATCC 11539]EPQ52345.1 hypothetical protein GLOTRDRAFT_140695 [Gloeophyllum trabeum ATCC 11539]